MKTPKEILLDRHRRLEPSLDRIRMTALQAVESRERTQLPDAPSPPEPMIRLLWRELFLHCQRYWLGLGTAWCVIVLFAVLENGNGASSAAPNPRPSETAIQALREQRRLRAELLGQAMTAGNNHPARREQTPGPRSEGPGCFINV